QAAAGVAGIMKMVLAMRHGLLPQTLGVDEPSSHIDWTAGAVELLTEARPWPETGRPRRAGVSSFGLSGTNAHIILEQAPVAGADDETPEGDARLALAVVPWVLSAKSDAGVRGQAARLLALVAGDTGPATADIGLSLVTTRAAFDRRAVVLGADRTALVKGLTALAEGREATGVVRGAVVGSDARAAFVFPGQGSQWVG
ncbi:polyketide synthase, partial [Streptomyces sp. SID8361]|nr:polyketide synthase [Streptomyces sp. SID8361]